MSPLNQLGEDCVSLYQNRPGEGSVSFYQIQMGKDGVSLYLGRMGMADMSLQAVWLRQGYVLLYQHQPKCIAVCCSIKTSQ